jgi:hypothetical protein
VTAFSGPISDPRRRRILALLVFSCLAPIPAYAGKESAREYFEKGAVAYNLGRFQDAIDWYEKAYQEHADPAFLFNLGQAHRQLGDCDRAAFFYRRFLSEDPNTTARGEVEARIAEQDHLCAEKAVAPPPPPPTSKPPPPPPRPPPPRVEVVVDPPDPLFMSVLELGVVYVSFGDLVSTANFRARLGAALPFRVGRLWFEPGINGAITPVRYQNNTAKGTAILSEVHGNLTTAVKIHDRFRARLELGAGVLVLSGLKPGNPYTEAGQGTSGALSMFSFQAGLGVDFALNQTLSLGVTPIMFSLSPPKAGLRTDIDRIQRISATAGISIRL